MSKDDQCRCLRPPRWVIPIGAGSGGIPPPLVAIFHHLPSWAVVAIALGSPIIGTLGGAISYAIIGRTDRRTLRTAEAAGAFREIVVEAAHTETLRCGLNGKKATVTIKRTKPDGGSYETKVEPMPRIHTALQASRAGSDGSAAERTTSPGAARKLGADVGHGPASAA
jgi:hypothetical protein